MRFFTVGWGVDEPFESIGAFQDFIGRYREAGIDEFMLGYWKDDDVDLPKPVPIRYINSPEMLECLALEVIPDLR